MKVCLEDNKTKAELKVSDHKAKLRQIDELFAVGFAMQSFMDGTLPYTGIPKSVFDSNPAVSKPLIEASDEIITGDTAHGVSFENLKKVGNG